MKISHILADSKVNNEDLCLADCAITHTILKHKKYLSTLTILEANVNTISGSINLFCLEFCLEEQNSQFIMLCSLVSKKKT